MELDLPFRHSLPVPDEIFDLPVYVTGAGWERVRPGASYPFEDANLYGFKWDDGRELPEFCLAWLEKGSGYLETKRGKQDIPERRAFFYPPGEWHRHRPLDSTGWTLLWIHFNGDLPHQWIEETAFLLDGNLPLIADSHLFRLQLVRLILTCHQEPSSNPPALSWQAAGLLSHFVKQGGQPVVKSAQFGDDLVNRAVHYIWNHSHAFVDVSEVVACVGCSRRVLERRFARVLERSVLDEIQRCRLSRAKRLLGETRLPVKQVVFRAGLRSHQQLCLLFQQQMGMSPIEYREHVLLRGIHPQHDD